MDLERKRRKGTISSAGSDLERLIHDKGVKEKGRRKKSEKKGKNRKKAKTIKKGKKAKGK